MRRFDFSTYTDQQLAAFIVDMIEEAVTLESDIAEYLKVTPSSEKREEFAYRYRQLKDKVKDANHAIAIGEKPVNSNLYSAFFCPTIYDVFAFGLKAPVTAKVKNLQSALLEALYYLKKGCSLQKWKELCAE